MIELCLNIVIALALAITIIGGWALDKRLRQFYQQRQKLEDLLQQVNQVMAQTGSHIHKIEQIVVQADSTLQQKINQALHLQDDLTYISKRADELANTLAANITRPQPPATNLATGTDTNVRTLTPLRPQLQTLR